MEVRNQERNIIALCPINHPTSSVVRATTYLDGLPPQNEEGLRSLRQEPRELVDQDMFYLIGLFDLYAYPHAVDAGLDVHLLVLIPCDGDRIQQKLRGAACLNLGDIMSFGGLGREVGEGEGGRERRAHALEVRAE